MATPTYRAGTDGTQSTTTVVFDKPTGAVLGDCIIGQSFMEGDSRVITPPAGFTMVGTINTGKGFSVGTWWKILGPSEPTTYTFSFSGGGSPAYAGGRMECYQNINSTRVPVVAMDAVYQASGTSHTAPTVTTTVLNSIVIYIAVDDSGVMTYSPATSPQVFTENVDTLGDTAASAIFVAVGATGTITYTTSSGSCFATTFAFAPEQPQASFLRMF